MGLKLDSLYLENFKCYENSGEIPFHNLTVFIGENNAGKSTIYDALELVLNNIYPKNDDFREGKDEIIIKSVFTFSREIDELSQYNINNTITIKKKFVRNAVTVIEILGKKFLDDDLNKFKNMTAPDLKALLERLSLPAQNNQELRKSSIEEYINETNPTTVDDYIVVNWNQISSSLPIFQRYSSSDYGNPTSSIRKTLDLVYREAFYEEYIDDDDGKIKYKLKDSFSGLYDEISESLNQKLETQLLANIKKYNQEVESVSGDYDIDFAKGLNFSGLIIKNNRNENRNIEQLGEGSKKKIFLSILEWDSEITSATLHNRNIIRGYDEPDAYLHYNAQREMFYMIQSLAENPESNMQSIICTHALTMIDRAPARTINHVIKNIDNL